MDADFARWVDQTATALEAADVEQVGLDALVTDYEKISVTALVKLPAVSEEDPEVGFGLWCRLTGAGAQAMAVLIADSLLAQQNGERDAESRFNELGARVQRAAVRIAQIAATVPLARRLATRAAR